MARQFRDQRVVFLGTTTAEGRGGMAMKCNEVTPEVMGGAIDVHRAMAPGLLESAHGAAGSRIHQAQMMLLPEALRCSCGLLLNFHGYLHELPE